MKKLKTETSKKKAIIIDSGPLINLALNGLLYILEDLKANSNVNFLITKQVKYETIDKPSGIPRFELGALQIKELLMKNVLNLPDLLEIKEKDINELTKILMEKANHVVFANGKWVKIVSNAEISCLALSSILNEKKIENIIAIDERTTRLLTEKPKELETIFSKKLHQNVKLSNENLRFFSNFKFIRSTELVFIAYRKGLLKLNDPKALEAALYATKYKGASVSFEEINELKKSIFNT